MSYEKAMKWARKHPKGIKPDIIMSTGSGFWPSGGFLERDWWPYLKACEAAGVQPECDCETFYRRMVRGDAPVAPNAPLAGEADLERESRLDAERVTLELAQKSTRRIDAGRESIDDSPLFGGPRQGGLFS